MNTNMQGHNHGGKNHLFGMLGIGALVFVVLLVAGRSFREALPLAAVLACPLMMIGMMFMMRGGNGHQHNNDSSPDHASHDVTQEQPDSATSQTSQPPKITTLPSPTAPGGTS